MRRGSGLEIKRNEFALLLDGGETEKALAVIVTVAALYPSAMA